MGGGREGGRDPALGEEVSYHVPAAVQYWPGMALLRFGHALATVLDLPAANLRDRGGEEEVGGAVKRAPLYLRTLLSHELAIR